MCSQVVTQPIYGDCRCVGSHHGSAYKGSVCRGRSVILQSTHHSCGFLHHCVLHVVNGVALFRKLLWCKSALVVSVCAQTSVHTAHSCRRWAVEWRSVKSHLSAPQLSAPQLSGPADCCYLSSDKPQWAMCLSPCTWLCHPAHGWAGDAYRAFYALIL